MESDLTNPLVNIRTSEFKFSSNIIGREVTCTFYLPELTGLTGPLHLLLINDGQDLPTMNYTGILQELYEAKSIYPVLTVGITASEERVQEYGLSTQADFKGRGAKASEYRNFITEELLSVISENTNIENFASYTIAGFSLGAISALDIAWHHPEIFSRIGAFSGSFWWRSKDLDDGYMPDHRLAHKMVSETTEKPELKFWFQVGTKDETSDRDNNGIIDSIDDTTSLIAELYKKGYQRDTDVGYLELIGGRHDVETWGRMMPKFLRWAFAVKN